MATVSPPWAYTLQLPHDPRAPGVARHALRTVLAAHDMAELSAMAELLASELLTNAHLHSDGPYTLRLRVMEHDRLRVGVWDSNPDIPPPFKGGAAPRPPDDQERGRGLHLVQMLADNWGAYPLGAGGPLGEGGGKLLWVECKP
ncbi:ATP-binding protein [Streptomyces sp. NPDC000410]|uniref:ATP-binding protein n=1 Tax=Streptomyces sp. NPDC000410 TaxID=3154254 RepID=UPI003325A78D